MEKRKQRADYRLHCAFEALRGRGGGGPTAGPPPTLPAKAGLLEHRVTSEVHLTPKFTDASQSHILEVFMGEMMYLGFVF